MLQIPEIYTSKPSVHRNGATARSNIILRVTKIGAMHKLFCVIPIQNTNMCIAGRFAKVTGILGMERRKLSHERKCQNLCCYVADPLHTLIETTPCHII